MSDIRRKLIEEIQIGSDVSFVTLFGENVFGTVLGFETNLSDGRRMVRFNRYNIPGRSVMVAVDDLFNNC